LTVIIPNAGMIPTRPAASGIVPVATATVCNMTFSCGVNGLDRGKSLGKAAGRVLRRPKPTRADWRDIIDTQPEVSVLILRSIKGAIHSRMMGILRCARRTAKEDGSLHVPVCRPKYVFVKHRRVLV
jgi:hypothetical protein